MTQSSQRIDLQAAEWAVRLGNRPLTAVEQVELDAWLAADPRHRGVLLRARAGWADLDRLVALAGGRDKSSGPEMKVPQPRRWHVDRRWFAAASLAAITIAATSVWTLRHRNLYRSDVGEVRHVALSDGSSMVLNTATEATVNFDKTMREIQLATGEGLFSVAKDPGRPFVVRAGRVSVRAVGTVFSVRALDGQVDVTVTEGVVELMDSGGSGDQVIRRIVANEHATVLEEHRVEVQPIGRDEAERRLAWRDGLIDFTGEPLSAAVWEINRHNRRHVVVDDPALAARAVVGVFDAHDPEGFTKTVAAALGAQSVAQDDAIHLRPK